MYLLTNINVPLNKDEHKWIEQWLRSDAYKFTALAITMLQIIIMPILLVLHAYRLRKSKKKDEDGHLRFRYWIVNHVSLTAIALSFTSGIITISNYAAFFDQNTCRTMTIIQNIFWLLTKVAIYIVVLLRLQCAFWGSLFHVNDQFSRLCYVLIALFVFILCVGTALPYPIGVDSVHLSGSNFCLLIIPPWLIITPLMFDILCSTLSLYLFIKPIRSVMHWSAGNDDDLQKVLTKYILISSLAIFSNLFSSIWFTITDILIFTYFDVFINPICLILMQIQHDDIYLFLCKHCHRGVKGLIAAPTESVAGDLTIHPRNPTQPERNEEAKVSNVGVDKVAVPAASPMSLDNFNYPSRHASPVSTLSFDKPPTTSEQDIINTP